VKCAGILTAGWMPVLLAAVLWGMAVDFLPPTRRQQIGAVGSTSGLSETLRRALEPGEEFQPVPVPGPSDWLSNHREAGQTFEEFLNSRPNRPDVHRRVLYLLRLGSWEQDDGPSLTQLRQFMAAFFRMDVLTLPALDLGQARIESRRNPRTGQLQLLTGDILNVLERRLPDDAFALLGITMVDLYPAPNWNFVFGQALPRSRVGIYSFSRYDPRFSGRAPSADTRRLMLWRSCKVLAHETGHLFGIDHCIWYRCLMNGSNHLDESDARPLHLCPVDLRKLQSSIGFDIVERYELLRDFYRQAGFDDEMRWISKRIQIIEAPDRINH
jgi:archaemetzincin